MKLPGARREFGVTATPYQVRVRRMYQAGFSVAAISKQLGIMEHQVIDMIEQWRLALDAAEWMRIKKDRPEIFKGLS